MTTQRFLEVFALGSLRDLPDLDGLEAVGALGQEIDDEVEAVLDEAFGLDEDESADEGVDACEAFLEEQTAQPRFG